MYRRILAAVNEYTNSEMAARYAIVLSKSCGAKLLLVFVAEGGADRKTFKRAESAMERLFIQARDHGVEVESVTETGDPYRKIQGIVILQVGNVFARRSATDSIFRLGFLSNRLVLAGIGFELLLVAFIIYTLLGHAIFSTAPLGLDVWFVLLPFSAALFAAEETRKAYLRRVAGAGH